MSAPVNLLELENSDFKKFFDSFDHVFSDCDGVIWLKTPLSGSGDFFKLMKKYGKTVNYVSNNSMRTKEEYDEHFQAAGIENGFENLTIPSLSIAEYLKSVNFKKKVYCVSCSETLKMLESYGFQCIEGPHEVPINYEKFRQSVEDDEEIGAVVFDSDNRINLAKLYKASMYLKRPDVHFLNGATDRLVPQASGVLTFGTGIFTDIVKEQVKREPIQLGKPGKVFGEFAMKRAGVTDPSRVLFIGDMIEQDVGLGKAMGFQTVLLLTNIPEEEMMSHDMKPDFFAPSLGSLVPILKNLQILPYYKIIVCKNIVLKLKDKVKNAFTRFEGS